jgi:hypothetical protein
MQWEISRVEALTFSITVHAKHDVTSLAEDARIHWQLIDPNGNDPLVDAGAVLLDEFIAVDSTAWQSDTLSTTRTDDRPLIVRACAKRGSGNSYIYLEPAIDATSANQTIIINHLLDIKTAETDIKAVVDLIEDINRNRMEITNATGAVSLKDDSGVTLLSGSITDDSTTTTRTRLT